MVFTDCLNCYGATPTDKKYSILCDCGTMNISRGFARHLNLALVIRNCILLS
jgi:hypothetical protein